MKNNYISAITSTLVFFLFLASCQKSKKDNQEKPILKNNYDKIKKVKDKNYKKGIEQIADYQKEIRKGIDETKSTYKNGYLIEEFNKAIENKVAKKSSSKVIASFKERGPNNVPGRSRGVVIDPNNSNRWFIGTVGGGVWRTEDAGSNWTSLTDFKIPNLATSTIVMSQTDSNILYVGTGEPFGNLGAIGGTGVFKTTDGGNTWQSLSGTAAFGDVGKIIIDPANHDNVLVATSLGIYRTTDGGATWSQRYGSGGNRVQDLDADPSDFNIQYGSVNGIGIVKSTNAGVSWSLVFNVAIVNSNHDRIEMDVSEVNPSVLVVCAYSPGLNTGTVSSDTDLYISRNSGSTFTNLTAPNGAIADRLDLVGGQGWYDNIVTAHPFNENIFYVGGVELFKVTVNNDNSFTALEMAATNQNSNLVRKNVNVHVDQHGLEYIKGSNNQFRLLLANDGGVSLSNLSTDPGVNEGNWSDAVTGKNSTQFYGAAKQNGADNYLAGAQDNGCWISLSNSADSNTGFQDVFGGDGFEVIWHYERSGDFIVTSQNNVIGRYVNNAYSGFARLDGPIFYTKIANADNNPDTVFSIGQNGVLRSTDFAANWTLVPITSNFTSNATSSLNVKVSTADPNIVWAGAAMTESGSFVLHVSNDNGVSFNPAATYDNPNGTHNLFISGLGTSYTERNRAYALFSSQGRPKILKTEDLGQTWADISGFESGIQTGFPDVAVHSILEMPFNKDIIWAGTDIGLFETEDGGASWSIVSDIPAVAIYDMKIVNDQVVIATYGRGVWSATLTELSNYSPPAFLSPAIITYNQESIISKKANIKYNVTTDDVSRVKIFIDDVEKAELIQDFNTGITYTFDTDELAEGDHQVAVQLFDDTRNINTAKQNESFSIVEYKNPSDFIQVIDFEASDVYAFNNSSFVINNLSNNVSKNVLNNSEHPYQNDETYSVVLKQPLTLAQYNKDFAYEDFAIVESYTDNLNDLNSFYDFVIIEASTDLQNWVTLDKYDARRDSNWLAQSARQVALMNINDALFKEQSIDLLSKGFSIGDTVVFRFSLITDPGTTSYGWAIRSINKDAVASVRDVLKGIELFSVYPTISKGNFTIFGKNTLGKTKLQIVDLTGKSVYNNTLDFNAKEKQPVSVNLKSGIYILQVIGENNKKSSKKIIIE